MRRPVRVGGELAELREGRQVRILLNQLAMVARRMLWGKHSEVGMSAVGWRGVLRSSVNKTEGIRRIGSNGEITTVWAGDKASAAARRTDSRTRLGYPVIGLSAAKPAVGVTDKLIAPALPVRFISKHPLSYCPLFSACLFRNDCSYLSRTAWTGQNRTGSGRRE